MENEYDGVAKLIDQATATGIGNTVSSLFFPGERTFQAFVDGSGAVSATVIVWASNDGAHWVELATITLSGTDSDTGGFPSSARYAYHRGEVSAIAGTGAKVSLLMGA